VPYLIDSDIVIDHLNDEPAAIEQLDRLSQEGIAISVITYMEVFQGGFRTTDPAATQLKLDTFLTSVPILHVTPAIARRCALIREHLRNQGKRVRPRNLDLINAATAIEHGLSFVTRNTEDYDDIPGLVLLQPTA
jgi:tRNA(fMet)-specific endonuclease VapC